MISSDKITVQIHLITVSKHHLYHWSEINRLNWHTNNLINCLGDQNLPNLAKKIHFGGSESLTRRYIIVLRGKTTEQVSPIVSTLYFCTISVKWMG